MRPYPGYAVVDPDAHNQVKLLYFVVIFPKFASNNSSFSHLNYIKTMANNQEQPKLELKELKKGLAYRQ